MSDPRRHDWTPARALTGHYIDGAWYATGTYETGRCLLCTDPRDHPRHTERDQSRDDDL